MYIQAKQILKNGKATELLDASLLNAYDHDEFDRMVLAATLCIRREPIFRPKIDIVSELLRLNSESSFFTP